MGRRIVEVPIKTLVDVEHLHIPYPTPYQRSMWLGLLLQDKRDKKNKSEPLVWFLQFPLDEQGLLISSARNDFLQHIVLKLEKNIASSKQDEELHSLLEGSTCVFTPTPEAKAIFHAKAKLLHNQEHSPHYALVKEYLADIAYNKHNNKDNWQSLGLQGFADFSAQLYKSAHQSLLSSALPELPTEPLHAICCCMEHSKIEQQLTRTAITLIDNLLLQASADASRIAALVRAISNSSAKNLRKQLLLRLLNSALNNNSELLIAIALRCWKDLQQPELTLLYLECLAKNDNGLVLFDKLFRDLIFIPELRVFILVAIKDQRCSADLQLAVDQLINQTKRNNT